MGHIQWIWCTTIVIASAASSIDGNTGTDEAVVRAFDGFVDVYIDLQFSTYFVPSKLSAQDGMEVSLQNFEKVTIDGNVASTLLGTAAADTLTGDAGADTITGRGGADTLTGGSRSDKFVFESGDTGITEATADTITDFATGTDKIDIDAPGSYVEADGTSTANFAAFIAADASLTTAGRYLYKYNFTGGNTLVVIDENKSGTVNAGDTLIILTSLSTTWFGRLRFYLIECKFDFCMKAMSNYRYLKITVEIICMPLVNVERVSLQ